MMMFMLGYDIFWMIYSKEYFGIDKTAEVGDNVETPFKLALGRFSSSPYTNCSRVNLGNIIIPALMIRFYRLMDRRKVSEQESAASENITMRHRDGFQSNSSRLVSKNSTSVYFYVGWIGYSCAMIVWMLTNTIVSNALPPFIFITPFMFIPSMIYSLVKKDLVEVWKWKYEKRKIRIPGTDNDHIEINQSDISINSYIENHPHVLDEHKDDNDHYNPYVELSNR